MLRVGLDNYVDSATVTSSVETLGHTSSAVLDHTVTSWVGLNSCTLTLTWSSSKVIDLLTIHRIKIVTNVTITGKLATVTQFTDTFTNTDLNGIDVKTLYTALSGTIDELIFSFTGSGSPEIGYIWAGTKQDVLFEKIQIVDNSADITNITLGGFATKSKRSAFRNYQVTLQKELFTTQRTFIRNILSTGYGLPRPYIILADACLVNDAMLGILDSGKYQYDIFDVVPDRKTNITIGITEVFGGV